MSLFKAPKMPASAAPPPPPPPVPLPDEGDEAVRRRMREAAKSVRSRAGRSSTILTGELGDKSKPMTTAPKTILGAG